ncbi:MAG: hypothetical protein ACLURV_01510 [Gallintestinimicrobium sp.]
MAAARMTVLPGWAASRCFDSGGGWKNGAVSWCVLSSVGNLAGAAGAEEAFFIIRKHGAGRGRVLQRCWHSGRAQTGCQVEMRSAKNIAGRKLPVRVN